MNKSYRVIFNHERNAWVAVAEITPAKGKSSCKTTVSSVAGKVALTAAVATAMGTGLISEQAAADKQNITSGSNFTNTSNNSSGTYNDKFFRPGKTSTLKGSAGFFDAKGATEAKQIVMGNHSNNPSWYNDANINICFMTNVCLAQEQDFAKQWRIGFGPKILSGIPSEHTNPRGTLAYDYGEMTGGTP